jgi:Uncharacterised nucleotidyltransferase
MPVSRPEEEVLLCCARTTKAPEVTARIEALLREGMDWEYLLKTAHVHGMAPLLYWHLDAAHPRLIPESVFDHLHDHFRANSLHNLFLTGELLRLLDTFGAHGIPAVPYKGPALAAYIYGNLALRQFIDLDVMVHRHDVPKAKELLASLGYQPQHRLTRAQEAALLGSRGQYVFMRDDGKGAVELHWEITEHFSFPLDSERLWRRLEKVPLGGEVVPTLSPEDTLLVLCAHGSKHVWERLAWICDVAELTRACQDMRWEQVLAQASALSGERMLLLGLFLAKDLLGAALPDRVLQRVHADPTVKALAGRIYERLFREANGLDGLFERAYFHPLHLKMQERLPDKIRYCARAATTQTVEDWELLSLPSFLFPAYYVLRPIRLAGKYGLRMLERL